MTILIKGDEIDALVAKYCAITGLSLIHISEQRLLASQLMAGMIRHSWMQCGVKIDVHRRECACGGAEE